MKPIVFTEDHLDVLKELMNVAMGRATAMIAQLLHAFGTMHIPSIMISDLPGLKKYIRERIAVDNNYFVTKQLFGGPLGGEFIFIITDESATNLGSHLYEVQDAKQADIHDAVVELTNILSSTIVSTLTSELNTKVQFFAPTTQIVEGCKLSNIDTSDQYRQIIIISTQMEFQHQKIGGHICILTKDEMIEKLKTLIDQKLEELYS